jgi:saccharopine dehydrogenase-like NADP-dependent oxidoreductase
MKKGETEMKIVVLGGGGTIGRVIALALVQDAAEVVLADLDLGAAQKVAAEVGGSSRAVQVDVTDMQAMAKLLEGAGACINSANYYFNLTVMRSCLEAGVPYLDLGGLFHVTRKQLELHQAFREGGVTAILGLGSCPGVANVQSGWLAGMLDELDYVRIYNGATLYEGESLAAPYAIETILDEITKPAMIFREGEFVERPPLSEEEYYLFPEPIGWSKVHLSLHSEIATIPLSFAGKGIQESFFKITFFGYSEAALRKLQLLANLGLASREPIEVNGVEVKPRDVLLAVLDRLPQTKEKPISKGYKDVVTEVKGQKDGAEIYLRADTMGGPYDAWGISGGTVLVAVPPAVVARWLAEGRLDRPGVWPPEQIIEPAPFFEALAEYGFTTSLTRREVVSAPE